MSKKIQNFTRSALVKPVTINVGRAGAANMSVIQQVEYVNQISQYCLANDIILYKLLANTSHIT